MANLRFLQVLRKLDKSKYAILLLAAVGAILFVAVRSFQSDPGAVDPTPDATLVPPFTAEAPKADPVLISPVAGTTVVAGEIELRGQGEQGYSLRVRDANSNLLASTPIDTQGQWSTVIEITQPGEVALTLELIDPTGELVASADPILLNVAGASIALQTPSLEPPAAVRESMVLTDSSESGATGEIVVATSTPTSTPVPPELDRVEFDPVRGRTVIAGSGFPGDILRVMSNGELLSATIVDAAGRWQMTMDLPGGAIYDLKVENITLNGVVRATAPAVQVNVPSPTATHTPSPTATHTPIPLVFLLPPELGSGLNILAGSGTPGRTVQIWIDGAPVGTITVDPQGNWELPVELVNRGIYTFQVESLDVAGDVILRLEPVPAEVLAVGLEGSVAVSDSAQAMSKPTTQPSSLPSTGAALPVESIALTVLVSLLAVLVLAWIDRRSSRPS
ncbi:MAG: hypothetical protein NTV69_00760 [Caldilinea sp.]|nr:hypothetical protein [Caldilinea sp.]